MPTKLSEPWTFRGGRSLDDITLRILTGIDGTPMPSYAESLSVAEARAIAEHVLALAPVLCLGRDRSGPCRARRYIRRSA